MSQAKAGNKVQIHYKGTLDDGSQFDSSEGREPLEFELGSGQVIKGFDKAVEGMSVGDTKSVAIPPEDAYGQRYENGIQQFPLSVLPEDLVPEVGMTLQAQNQDRQPVQLVITEVGEETITVDTNHPLAGKTLNFEISLVGIA